MKNFFLSDLHIGVDAPTNLYQSKAQEPRLKAILRYIQNCKDVRDVVILGDWLDLWMYPSTAVPMNELPVDRSTILPTVEQIIEANPGVFQKNDRGDFISCIDSIKGNFYYINGNHDMDDSVEYLVDYFKDATKNNKGIKWINCNKEHKAYKSPLGEIYGEHGHWYSMVCKPDYKVQNKVLLYEDLFPFGYFITRSGMDGTQGDLSLTIQNIKKIMKENDASFSEAVLTIQAGDTANLAKLNFTLPKDCGSVSAGDIIKFFNFPPDAVDDPEFVIVDNGNNLDGVARDFFTTDKNTKIVIFGHTHDAKEFQDFSVVYNDGDESFKNQATYVNTGFLCAGEPDGTSGLPVVTFVEIEDTSDTVDIPTKLPYKINMHYVDFHTFILPETPLCTLNVVDLGNIALNKSASASSVKDNLAIFTPLNVVDDNNSTKWSSKYLDAQWICVNLEFSYSIDKVQLSWADEYGKDYKIQVSGDGYTWTDVYTKTGGNGGIENISFPAINANYVRMLGTKKGTYSLYGFKVYASSKSTTHFIMAQ